MGIRYGSLANPPLVHFGGEMNWDWSSGSARTERLPWRDMKDKKDKKG
jgi:hypothetical protein